MGKATLVGYINDIEIRHKKGDDGFLVWWFFAKKGEKSYEFDIRGVLDIIVHDKTDFNSSGMHGAVSNGTVLAFIQNAVKQAKLADFWGWICEDGGCRYHHGMSRAETETSYGEKGD